MAHSNELLVTLAVAHATLLQYLKQKGGREEVLKHRATDSSRASFHMLIWTHFIMMVVPKCASEIKFSYHSLISKTFFSIILKRIFSV